MRRGIVAILGSLVLAVTLGLGTSSAGDKQEVDHKGKTICVSVHAVPAHLAHGDTQTSPPTAC